MMILFASIGGFMRRRPARDPGASAVEE